MNSGTDTVGKTVRASKDSSLVYRACSAAYADLLGAREPRGVLGRRDTDLLRASRAAFWEATQRLVLLDGICSLTPLSARGRSGVWMIQRRSALGDGVDIDIVSSTDVLGTLLSFTPNEVAERAVGAVIFNGKGVVRADAGARGWIASRGGTSQLLGCDREAKKWQAWVSGRKGITAPAPSVDRAPDDSASGVAVWRLAVRWHRKRGVLLVPLFPGESAGGRRAVDASNAVNLVSQSALNAIHDVSPVGTLLVTGQRVQYANNAAVSLLAYESSEQLCANMVLPTELLTRLETVADGADALTCRWRRKDGRDLLAHLQCRWLESDGQRHLVVLISDNAPSLKQISVLNSDRDRFHDFAESAADFFFELDASLQFVYLSDRFEGVFGVHPDELLGLTIGTFHTRYLPQPTTNAWVRHLTALESGQSQLDFEYKWTHENGRARVLLHSCHSVVGTDGRFRGFRGVGRDITRDRELADQVEYHATHDALTGLINRREFERLLKSALAEVSHSDKQHALCFIDLDNFKNVNDTAGHLAGDDLLSQLGVLFIDSLRQSDVVARLGGDEFGVLIYNCDLDRAKRLCDDLKDRVRGYALDWQGDTFRVGASIGLVAINSNSGDMTTVLRDADLACYEAKGTGRSRVSTGPMSRRHSSDGKEVNPRETALVFREIMLPLHGTMNGDVQRLGLATRQGQQLQLIGSHAPEVHGFTVAQTVEKEQKSLDLLLAWLRLNGDDFSNLAQLQLRLSGRFLGTYEYGTPLIEQLSEFANLTHLLLEISPSALENADPYAVRALVEAGGKLCVVGGKLDTRAESLGAIQLTAASVAGIRGNSASMRAVRTEVEQAHAAGLQIQVTDVEHRDELPVLRELGVNLVSGAAVALPDTVNAFPS